MRLPLHRTRVTRIALALCAAIVASVPALAQKTTGSISGVVVDPDGNAIPDVEITLPTAEKTARSDTAGNFFFGGVPTGTVELRFRRLAFAPARVMVDVEGRDTASITVTLSVVAQVLNAVVVQEDAARIRLLRAFDNRRKQGFGHFITRQDIEQRQPRLLSDMARRIPGAVITMPSMSGRSVLRFSRSALTPGRDCPPQYWIDGIMAIGFNIDDIMPGDVEGIEFYAGPSVTPPEFNNPRGTPVCGTVVIWTRVPSN